MQNPQYSKSKDSKNDEFVFQPPRIALLKKQHWAYIQKRYHMSPRERQVAEFVCSGLTNEEIAKTLKIKRGTVKTHLRNIYRRIRVKNKITMLLKVVDSATKFCANSGTTPPIPIVEIKESAAKHLALPKKHKKDK